MTTHFTSHFRRPIGVLAGLALLASLLVAAPGPIKAQDPEPDYLASFEACPEDVIPSADFSDVSSRHENAQDIDCIAYYGITRGTSATTYSPLDPVIREHMALFLVRLAKLVGIRVPRASSTPFTDIADLNDISQEAISQIYQLGITIGATGTTYAPTRHVSRGEMALFLQRLMDLMVPIRDRRDSHGYIPEDVDDNRDDFDIESPFRDLLDVRVTVFDAVTQLYELGIASGLDGSSLIYGPTTDMSRAAMAEFMAGILDHSNLRPRGVTVQVVPTQGLDNFEIVMMISVRDATFDPVDDQPVDWFYSDDEDGGLDRGECDEDLIRPGGADCVWEGDDDETDGDGNIFEDDIEATAGATMTFYAWIGREDEEFDEDEVTFSQAVAESIKGADSIKVSWRDRDIPPNALVIEGAYVVDLEEDSIEFTIQLQDDEQNDLEMEGVEIEIEVDSRDIIVNAADASDGTPEPSFAGFGSRDESDSTVFTDEDGEATFELEAPRRDERLDKVTFNPDCEDCESREVQIAWSTRDRVLVTAQPEFNSYQLKSSSSRVSLQVRYQLYDQYGKELSGVTASRTGRPDTTARATLAYGFYSVPNLLSQNVTTLKGLGSDETISPSGGRFTKTVSEQIETDDRNHDGFFLVLKPTIFSDSDDDNNDTPDTNEVKYLKDDEVAVVVWFVKEATKATDLPGSCEFRIGLRVSLLDNRK